MCALLSANVLCYIGIFGYLNYLLPRSRKYILEILIGGLERLEYRGYDSAGVAFDSSTVLEDGASLLQTEYVLYTSLLLACCNMVLVINFSLFVLHNHRTVANSYVHGHF